MGKYRLLEHTADMGIEASGETREELFIQTALGLKEMIAGGCDSQAMEEKGVEVEGGDEEELLVNWLNEILYLLEVRHFFPDSFRVEEIGEGRLRGSIRGEPFDPERHTIEREVKSVTYHQLLLERKEGAWRARIYVDL